MTIRHFVNRKIGLSTDTKPTAQNLRTVIYHEDNTGNTYLSDGTTTTLTQGRTVTESYQNKTLSVEQNTIPDLIEDSPFSLTPTKRKGGIIPASTVADSFYGILEDNGVVLYNPNQVKTSSGTNGLMVSFQGSITNEKVGFATLLPIAKREDSYEIKLQFKSRSSLRTLIGFSATQNYPDSSNHVFGFSQIGICVGFTYTTSNFSIFTNDGVGANQAIPIPFNIPKDKALHTLEIKLQSTKVICTLDNQTIEVTQRLPPLTTGLYLVIYGVI